MSSFLGKYTKFICLRNCNDGQKNWSNNTIYDFKVGEIYGTSYTPWFLKQKNSIYTEKETYEFGGSGAFRGMVSAEFLTENFMAFDEYKKNSKELKELFESYMEL